MRGSRQAGVPRRDGAIVQECGAGLVPIRRSDAGLAFAAPPLVRSGPVDDELVDRVATGCSASSAPP